MQILRTRQEVRDCLDQLRWNNLSVALVPTMGNLHQGHIALIKAARQYADKVAVSLFVNPLQFDSQDDLDNYPRTLERDLEYLRFYGVPLAFLPDIREMYPSDGDSITILSDPLENELCGQYRPGHFKGVLTVVAKLFNLFSPDVAVFGEKDYQQLVLIKIMARQLFSNLPIISVATVRETDGLALSSRNSRMNASERACAPVLYQTLQNTAAKLRAGERDFSTLIEEGKQHLLQANFTVDYLEIRAARMLKKPEKNTKNLIVLAAAHLGTTRLIDNVITSPSPFGRASHQSPLP